MVEGDLAVAAISVAEVRAAMPVAGRAAMWVAGRAAIWAAR